MKERPILFNSAMVNAILEGRKTQTRRLIKAPIFSQCDDEPWEMALNDGVLNVIATSYRDRLPQNRAGSFELKSPLGGTKYVAL